MGSGIWVTLIFFSITQSKITHKKNLTYNNRSYEKSGFIAVKEMITSECTALLMEHKK